MGQRRTYTPCPVPCALPGACCVLRTRWGSTFPKPHVRQQKQNIQGNRIPDGKGGWKNHREDTTDWNNQDNAEKWRAAWATYANRALEAAGRPERIDHRSYERQGVDKIPSIHMGVAASQMERKGIQTEKGNVNRQIAADNKLLKELKARITRIYNWSKEQANKKYMNKKHLVATREDASIAG